MAEKSERERESFIIQGQNQIHKTELLFIELENT